MSLLANIRQRINAGFRAFQQFDGASDNPQRSSTVYFPLDSTREIKPYERREMVKKHRSLRNNLGFVRGIINTTVRLSIGWGLQPAPTCPDKAFRARAVDYWKRHTNRRGWDVRGKLTEPAMQRLVLRETITDGELFGVKVWDGFGQPQRQLIKTELIGDPPGKGKDDNWQDGILLNSLDKALAYSILQRSNPLSAITKRAATVDAADMIHVFDLERATQVHGLPWGYTGLNHGVDALDIAAFEKIAHKLNTAIVGAVTTQTGEAPKNMEALLAAAAEATSAGTSRSTRESARYLDIHGTQVPIFKTGESMNLFLQGRNSLNTTEFAGWLCAQYAQGFGVPVNTVIGLIQGSAAVRGDLELAGRFFEEVQMSQVESWDQPNWETVIGTGILAWAYPNDNPGIEPLQPPNTPNWAGWNCLEWRGPKNITVDRGRDGKLYLDQIRAGIMTHEEYWTMNAEDPLEMEEKATQEVADRRERWLAAGLPEDQFWIREHGQAAQGSQKQDAQPPDSAATD